MGCERTHGVVRRIGAGLGVAGAATALALIGNSLASTMLSGNSYVYDAPDTRLVADTADLPPVPADFFPPGELAGPANPVNFGIPPFLFYTQGDYPFQIFSDPDDNTGDVVGTYSIHNSVFDSLFANFGHDVVYDSTGMAPADGTVYEQFTALPSLPGLAFIPPLFTNYLVSGPAGIEDLFVSSDFENYFSLTSTGLIDTIYLSGTEIPILDIPF
jgi:hypothetical protein